MESEWTVGPVFRQESGIRNSRRDSTQEWAMSGQVQELQVPGTPEGGTLARVLARTLHLAVLQY